VSAAIVKQRLKLAGVSAKLLDVYAQDGMTLEQLMAFTVTSDHARQERVWESLAQSWNNEPHHIRRQLTEGAVRASDKRARFVGIAAYEAAGGIVTRDLFEDDDGGWLQDPALLDRLATEKLKTEAEALRGEGWKWIAVAPDFPYGHTAGLRRLAGETVAMTAEEQATYEALEAEYVRLQEQYAANDDLPEEVDQRLGEIERAVAQFEDRPVVYDRAAIARAGMFVSIDSDGDLHIERGFVHPEDEAPADPGVRGGRPADGAPVDNGSRRTVITVGGPSGSPESESEGEEEGGLKPLSDRLVVELTAHRTLALREALARSPDAALTAVLHNLCLASFYGTSSGSCLEISAKSASFTHQAPGLADTASAKAIEARHDQWTKRLPNDEGHLWGILTGLDHESRMTLLAHCAALSVNAVQEPLNRNTRRLAHADTLARAVNLDMAASWSPTVDNYLGRVPKARFLDAVREAKGEASAQLIDHLKKPDMARESERLLAGTGWLPEPLRPQVSGSSGGGDDDESLPAFLDGSEDEEPGEDEPDDPAVIAAE
jgi:ParB family transcriptional regulator, chromosome partitioning protein